jgi:hypothetical protein
MVNIDRIIRIYSVFVVVKRLKHCACLLMIIVCFFERKIFQVILAIDETNIKHAIYEFYEYVYFLYNLNIKEFVFYILTLLAILL